VPPELAQVLERMLAKDPARRYQAPAEVAEALAPFVEGGAAPLAAGPPPPREPAPGLLSEPGGAPRGANTDAEPTVAGDPAPAGRAGRRWPRAFVAVLLLGGLGWLGVSVFRLVTATGELVIQVEDADIEVVVRGEGATISDRSGKRRFELRPGE